MRSTALGLAALLAACGVAAAEPAARSGTYDSLTLAVSGDAVAGVFSEQRGAADAGGPQFACVFLLRGTIAGDRAKVETWFPNEPERIPGDLAFTPDGAALTVAEDHDGCSMTTGTMVGTPYALSQRAAAQDGWIGVGLVTAERTAFRPEPGPAPARAPYLVRLDPVAVLERRDAWVRVRYRGEKAPVIGWLPAANLAVVMP
ncbi:hypothetical protein [Methylobacterium sp. J-090]|uniref:hypothetical protein n=1 Tax=Methylobacterium sp. J-090 TaxID=2836666 RepID=UPI001FBAA2E6|nr:hypothetical protein [Methylobacterium sp. J-090]MCJ2081816.1 hypothetical protein [Methylobacterium sp. J-090]